MLLYEDMVDFVSLILDGSIWDLVIRIMQPLKTKIPSLSNHIRETNFHGIPTHHHSKTSNRNHHHQSLNFTQELVANLHQTSMCLHIRRHKKTPTK